MPDSSPPDASKDEKARSSAPSSGVIDLDAVDADARNALWGPEPTDTAPDAEDETPVPDDVSLASSVPPSPPKPAPIPAAPSTTRVELPPVEAASSDTPPSLPDGAPPLAPHREDTPTHRIAAAESAPPESASSSTPLLEAANDASSTPDPTLQAPQDRVPTEPALPDSLRPSEAIVQTAKEATKDRGRELVALVTEYGKRHLPETPARARQPDTGPPRLVGRIGQLIPVMRVLPWVLSIGFAASFLWDFPGTSVTVLGRVIPLEGLLRILSISGMIGFLTNWLAITMLFQPREKRAIIPQGLIPAQRERVIYRLSEAISRELINADIIKQKIQESGVVGRYRDLGLSVVRGVVEDPDFRADLKALAQRYAQETLGSEEVRRELAKIAVDKVEQQAGQGLGGAALKLYRTFAEDDFQRRVDNALRELPQAVTPLLDRIDEALDAVPEKVEARGDEIEEAATKAVLSFVEGFDIQAMIQEKARGFDEAQLENLLKSTSNEQLNYIKYLGGILGVFGGLVIWRAEMLIVFVAIGLVLWALDEILVRARRTREAKH